VCPSLGVSWCRAVAARRVYRRKFRANVARETVSHEINDLVRATAAASPAPLLIARPNAEF
jgi:hypothetical protein